MKTLSQVDLIAVLKSRVIKNEYEYKKLSNIALMLDNLLDEMDEKPGNKAKYKKILEVLNIITELLDSYSRKKHMNTDLYLSEKWLKENENAEKQAEEERVFLKNKSEKEKWKMIKEILQLMS